MIQINHHLLFSHVENVCFSVFETMAPARRGELLILGKDDLISSLDSFLPALRSFSVVSLEKMQMCHAKIFVWRCNESSRKLPFS